MAAVTNARQATLKEKRGCRNLFLFFAADFFTLAVMSNEQAEVLSIFTRTRALLQGHFVLRSGLHSGHYFQCAQVAPAMGGLVIGQEVARQAKVRYIFAEKENNVLVLRRGFTLRPGERILVVEDVVTRGGRVVECLEIVRQAGGNTSAVAMLVDRSAGTTRFTVPAVSLLELSFPTYAADAVPAELASIPVQKPGS
jgi:orotate phosphoribosyltransferase